MLKLSLPLFLLALCFFLGATTAGAQEQLEMKPPPIPDILPPPPPDPDALPPPSPLEWAPLEAKDSLGQSVIPVTTSVAPPLEDNPIAPPPPPIIEPLLNGLPDPVETELAKPDVEIWRLESQSPQVPARHSNRLEQAYVTGNAPVTLRAQFDRAAAGKTVYVRPGQGVSIGSNEAALTVSSNGDCIIAAQLIEGFTRGHIIFYCEGVRTVLPVVRSSLEKVVEQEALTGSEQ